MKKLILNLWIEGKTVYMKVIQQDEDTRAYFDENLNQEEFDMYYTSNNKEFCFIDNFKFTGNYGLYIKSMEEPELNGHGIHIRGTNRDLDNKICSLELPTVLYAQEYMRRIQKLVDEYNENLMAYY